MLHLCILLEVQVYFKFKLKVHFFKIFNIQIYLMDLKATACMQNFRCFTILNPQHYRCDAAHPRGSWLSSVELATTVLMLVNTTPVISACWKLM